MAAAATQSTVGLPKKAGGSPNHWTEFGSFFRIVVEVTEIAGEQRVAFWKLYLKDSALKFFHTLEENSKAQLELTLTASKNQFCNPNLKEIDHINKENMKFNPKTECPEVFLVKFQNITLKAYPAPVDKLVAPVDGSTANDQDGFDRETQENRN